MQEGLCLGYQGLGSGPQARHAFAGRGRALELLSSQALELRASESRPCVVRRPAFLSRICEEHKMSATQNTRNDVFRL